MYEENLQQILLFLCYTKWANHNWIYRDSVRCSSLQTGIEKQQPEVSCSKLAQALKFMKQCKWYQKLR